jgi:hypothetical protein
LRNAARRSEGVFYDSAPCALAGAAGARGIDQRFVFGDKYAIVTELARAGGADALDVASRAVSRAMAASVRARLRDGASADAAATSTRGAIAGSALQAGYIQAYAGQLFERMTEGRFAVRAPGRRAQDIPLPWAAGGFTQCMRAAESALAGVADLVRPASYARLSARLEIGVPVSTDDAFAADGDVYRLRGAALFEWAAPTVYEADLAACAVSAGAGVLGAAARAAALDDSGDAALSVARSRARTTRAMLAVSRGDGCELLLRLGDDAARDALAYDVVTAQLTSRALGYPAGGWPRGTSPAHAFLAQGRLDAMATTPPTLMHLESSQRFFLQAAAVLKRVRDARGPFFVTAGGSKRRRVEGDLLRMQEANARGADGLNGGYGGDGSDGSDGVDADGDREGLGGIGSANDGAGREGDDDGARGDDDDEGSSGQREGDAHEPAKDGGDQRSAQQSVSSSDSSDVGFRKRRGRRRGRGTSRGGGRGRGGRSGGGSGGASRGGGIRVRGRGSKGVRGLSRAEIAAKARAAKAAKSRGEK